MTWQPIKTAPKDGTHIDVWLNVPASPRSMGIADRWREIDVWWRDGWVHYHQGEIKELFSPYVTHWMPIPKEPRVKAAS